MQDKGIFFLVISLGCFWLVLDEFYGKNLITKFITKMIPNAKESEDNEYLFDI